MGGAKNCPETPRQKMIGMMYLVLTAMLALNVSANILGAFETVDKSLHASLDNSNNQISEVMNRFATEYQENPEKVGARYMQADSLRVACDTMYNYLESFKQRLHQEVDQDIKEGDLARHIVNNSDVNTPGAFATNQYDPITGLSNGKELVNRMSTFREQMIHFRHAEEWRPARNESHERHLKDIRDKVNTTFSTEDGMTADNKRIDWIEATFHDMPAGAVMAILTKYQNDIRSFEYESLVKIHEKVGGNDFRANKIKAYVIPKSDYVIRGSQFEAQLILAAVDSTQRPIYILGNDTLNDDGIIRITASGIGEQPLVGKIIYKQGNEMKEEPFESFFTVGEPSASVMNTDLMVIYKEYDNKYLVSAPGMTDNQLNINVIGGTFKRNGKLYVVRPNNDAQEVRIVVNAKNEDGSNVKMGEQVFQVKNLPTPQPYFELNSKAVDPNKAARKELTKSTTLEIGYGPDQPLKVPFEVTRFETNISRKINKSQGNKFSAAQLKQIGNLKSGDVILVTGIYYRVEGGSEQKYNMNYSILLK